MTNSKGEVSIYLSGLNRGDEDACQAIWEAYFSRLVSCAQRKLPQYLSRAADGEDIALSAMCSFFRGMKNGAYEITDRGDLWKLLISIASHKANDERRRQTAQKRGGGFLRGESIFFRVGADDGGPGIDQAAIEPSPEFVDDLVEHCEEMLNVLEDKTLRMIAVKTLEGYRPREIADELDCAKRTVERKLERIRTIWTDAGLS